MSWRAQSPDGSLEQSDRYDTRNLELLLEGFTQTRFVFVQWIDIMGQMRSRCLPIPEFTRLVRSGKPFAISYGNLGTLQNDHLTEVCKPVGSIYVEPDLSLASLRPMYRDGPVKDAATVMARFVDEGMQGLNLCPRAALQITVDQFKDKHKAAFLVGFEIEVTFCKRTSTKSGDAFMPLDTNHAWSTFSTEQYTESMPLMLLIATALQEIGIEIQQVHSESGAGQYEFVLPPQPPVYAVDTLVQARQCIMQIAATKGLRATCHAQPFEGIGTAAHAHISYHSTSSSNSELEQLIQWPFIAGVLAHLPSLCAVTMPQGVSYSRVADNTWTSGRWVTWGTQNREVPLRRSGPLRWELRCLDGFANTYLALHAFLSAGLMGIEHEYKLLHGDCTANPSTLDARGREELGIVTQIPNTIDQAIAAAWQDEELREMMSDGILKHYLYMKEAEQKMLTEMDEQERRIWLIERY